VTIANPVAGAASKLDLAHVETRLREELGGRFGGFHIAQPHEIEAILRKLIAEKPAALIVLGGDGTARAAAKAVLSGDRATAIVPLPAGTMNILPRLVFGHADLDRAIGELSELEPSALPVGIAGGEPFFLSVAFGFAASLARFRETMRPPRVWPEVGAAAGAMVRASLHSVRGGPLWRAPGGRWRRAHTLVVAVGSVKRVTQPDSAETHAEQLEVAAMRLRSGIDALRFGGVALTSGWRNSRHMELREAESVAVRIRSRRPMIVLDGEPVRVTRMEQVTISPNALPILAPQTRADPTR
jgi:diacylglycerol kinase family enzyme